jgi:glycosyltransferase involved in cell wall biosynthesis
MYFFPEPGGGSTTASNRASILSKIGYEVFVLCGFPSYPSGKVTDKKYKGKFFYVEKMGNITLIRVRLLPIASEGFFKRFILFMNFIFLSLFWMPKILSIASKVTLVYAMAPILFSSFIGCTYSRFTKSFFIYEATDLWPEEIVAFKTKLSFIIFTLGKKLANLSYSLPDMIVVTSTLASKYVTNNYNPRAPIHVMFIGADPTRYEIKSKEHSRQVLVGKKILPRDAVNKFIVLYSGIISKITRIENVVLAANELNGKENNILFLVIGEGDEKPRLEEIKQRNNLNNLYFLPFQDFDLVSFIISAADICVISLPPEPIYEVTISTKFFDYLVCHKPQLGICGGELADIINSNKLGFTVMGGEIGKLVDKILFLKKSPSLMKEMEKNSHVILPQFSLDNLARNFNEVLIKEINKR